MFLSCVNYRALVVRKGDGRDCVRSRDALVEERAQDEGDFGVTIDCD